MDKAKAQESFGKLLDIMDTLREKCPWDREQTLDSIRPLTIEEVYELSEAILDKDAPNICKELGDILLHIVFYAKIADEQGLFDVDQVMTRLSEKLIYRHPHVYGQTQVQNTREVLNNWEQLKVKEKEGNKRILSGVPKTLPALIKAYRIQDKARGVGFDWEEKSQVWEKVEEETREFKEAAATGKAQDMEEEFGDLLFATVNAARLYGIDPENALERANRKFIRRFTYLEEHTIRQGRSLKEMTLAQMDEIWDEAKRLEREAAAPEAEPGDPGQSR